MHQHPNKAYRSKEVNQTWDERPFATYLRPTEWDERQVYYRPSLVYSQARM